MTREQIAAQLSGVTYEDAINYYRIQKEQFKNQYLEAAEEIRREAAAKDIDEVIAKINTKNDFQGRAFGAATDIIKNLEAAFAENLEGDISQLSALIQNEKNEYSKISTKGRQALIDYVAARYDLYEITRMITTELSKMNLPSEGASINDLLSWSRSILYARVFYTVKGTYKAGAFEGRKITGAGYFEEALVHKAFSELGEKLQKHVSMMTGSAKIKSGKYNVDSIFDEYINFLSDVGNLQESFTSSIDPEQPTILKEGFGIQSKIWSAPWDLKSVREGGKLPPVKKIASNTKLYQVWSDQYSWIKGILFLEKHVREALGDNVGYMLGNQFYWTYELIQQFRQYQYYLAFHFEKNAETKRYEPDSTIAWEQIRSRTVTEDG